MEPVYINPIQAAQDAIAFAKKYYNSSGFQERFNKFNNVSGKQFLYSPYNPNAFFDKENGTHDAISKNSWRIVKTPLKIGKIRSIPESNAYYNPDSGNILYGDNGTLERGLSKTWDQVMGHEVGHMIDWAIKPRHKSEQLDNYNDGYGYTYSNMHPIFRKSKAYQKVKTAMYNLGQSHGRIYEKDPSYGSYMISDGELFHDAMPMESYADLFQMRKMLYDQKIFDSTKSGIKFTKKHLEKFKKNNHIRLQDNFSDEDIIWMMNNVAQNNKKINPRQTQI